MALFGGVGVKRCVLLLICCVSGPSPAAAVEGTATAAKDKVEACTSCHEGDGRSAGLRLYPRIAGQHYQYLLQALREYRSGERKAGYAIQMTDSVKDLSDRDLQDLARYYSELPW